MSKHDLDLLDYIILICESTDWQAYYPKGKNKVAAIHSWYPKRKYFKTEKQFIEWAKKELDV